MITAAIVLFNNDIDKLNKAIFSFLDSKLDLKLFLIDNSPTDAIEKEISTSNKVQYIHNSSNIGFGAAHNIGINLSIKLKSNYHLILNPDVYFDSTVITELVKYATNNKDVGLLMPLVLYPDERIQYLCRLLPTPLELFLRRFFFRSNFVNKLNEISALKFTGYNKIMNVPYLSGCFMFCKTDVLSEIGGFDNRFFMYMEDLDLSRRINSKYKTIFYPNVHIYHHFEKGSFKNFKLLKHHLVSAVKYFNKWGWFFDSNRKTINNNCLKNLK